MEAVAEPQEKVKKAEQKKLPDNLQMHIEALIFVAESAVTIKEIMTSLEKSFETSVPKKDVLEALKNSIEKYQSENFPFELIHLGGGYQFLSRSQYHKTVSHYLNIKSRRRLSTAAVETLSIIAYKQPVTKSMIEEIRGVTCDYSVQKLLEKELIEIIGRSEGPGRPLLYGTSKFFIDYFGLNSIDDMPKLKEVIPQHNEIGSEEATQETQGVESKSDNGAESASEETNPEILASAEKAEGEGSQQAESGEQAEKQEDSQTEDNGSAPKLETEETDSFQGKDEEE